MRNLQSLHNFFHFAQIFPFCIIMMRIHQRLVSHGFEEVNNDRWIDKLFNDLCGFINNINLLTADSQTYFKKL